jgi:hypothetical protein
MANLLEWQTCVLTTVLPGFVTQYIIVYIINISILLLVYFFDLYCLCLEILRQWSRLGTPILPRCKSILENCWRAATTPTARPIVSSSVMLFSNSSTKTALNVMFVLDKRENHHVIKKRITNVIQACPCGLSIH